MHKEKESEMEPLNQRSTTPLERVVSQRALQMSNSFPCQICAVAIFCGLCIVSLILAILGNFGNFQFAHFSMLNLSFNSDLNTTISKLFSLITFIYLMSFLVLTFLVNKRKLGIQ